MPDELDDARSKALMERFANQDDKQAMDELIARHEDAVRRLVKRRVARQEVKDLCQEVWFRAINGAKTYVARPDAKFETWLLQVANNVVREFRKKQVPVADLATPEDVSDLEDEAPEQVEHEQRLRAIKRALSKLPEEQRKAIFVRHFEGKTVGQTAMKMGTTKRTIKHRLEAALEKLPAFFRKEIQ